MIPDKICHTIIIVCCAGLVLLAAQQTQAKEGYGNADDPVAAEALGVEIRTTSPDEMAYAIKQILLMDYMKEQKLQATDSEIAGFLERKKQADADGRQHAQARQAEIQTALKSGSLPTANRKQLEDELRFIDEMLRRATESDKQKGDPQHAEIESRMAGAFIEQWKVNRSLYEEYGGRLVYQQGGAEPLDAYRDFLKAAEQSGDFRIMNESFEPSLWSYFTDEKKHRFYPEDENIKNEAINTPWWMRAPASPR